MSSIEYYNQNAQAFFDRTINANVPSYEKFFSYCPKGARILDAGCGSGRDSLFFRKKGFDVFSFDGSEEMVKMSSQLLETEVKHLHFQDITFCNEFDAIWASASLLHVPYDELESIFQKLNKALKPHGILYASFKHGDSLRVVKGRSFYDMNEKLIVPYLKGIFNPLKIWVELDTRSCVAPSPTNEWFNFIARKQ